MPEPRRDDVDQPNQPQENATRDDPREIAEGESSRDRENAQWWKNEGRQSGEVH